MPTVAVRHCPQTLHLVTGAVVSQAQHLRCRYTSTLPRPRSFVSDRNSQTPKLRFLAPFPLLQADHGAVTEEKSG